MQLKVAAGEEIDRYVVESPIGEGGMGSVYRAFDTRLRRRVALKLLQTDGGAIDREQSERMLREARAVAALSHPNVVTIFDVGESEGSPFLAMELLSGSTLRAVMHDEAVTLERKLRWLEDIADALGAAHRAGLVHRDVKPENVMVLTAGSVKVLDFGLARSEGVDAQAGAATSSAPSSFRTAGSRLLGTPRYMAPEQAARERLDARADQFSWGLVAYELLSLTHPADARPEFSSDAGWSKPARPLAELAPFVPAQVAAVIMRALERDRDRRWPTMEALVATLAGAGRLVTEEAVVTSHARGARSLAPTVSTLAILLLGGSALFALRSATRAAKAPPAPDSTRSPVACALDESSLVDLDPAPWTFHMIPLDGGALLAGGVAAGAPHSMFTGEAQYAAAARLPDGRMRRRLEKDRWITASVAQPAIGTEPLLAVYVNQRGAGTMAFLPLEPSAAGNEELRERGVQLPFMAAALMSASASGRVFAAALGVRFSMTTLAGADAGRLVNDVFQIRAFSYAPGEAIAHGVLAVAGFPDVDAGWTGPPNADDPPADPSKALVLLDLAASGDRAAALVNRDAALEVVFFDRNAQPIGMPVRVASTTSDAGALAFRGDDVVVVWSKPTSAGTPGPWETATVIGSAASQPRVVPETDGATAPHLVTVRGDLAAAWIRRRPTGTELRFAIARNVEGLERASVVLRTSTESLKTATLAIDETSRWIAWREGTDRALAARLNCK